MAVVMLIHGYSTEANGSGSAKFNFSYDDWKTIIKLFHVWHCFSDQFYSTTIQMMIIVIILSSFRLWQFSSMLSYPINSIKWDVPSAAVIGTH